MHGKFNTEFISNLYACKKLLNIDFLLFKYNVYLLKMKKKNNIRRTFNLFQELSHKNVNHVESKTVIDNNQIAKCCSLFAMLFPQ